MFGGAVFSRLRGATPRGRRAEGDRRRSWSWATAHVFRLRSSDDALIRARKSTVPQPVLP